MTAPAAPAGSPLRIVLLTEYFEPEIGAAPVRVSAVARALAGRGHEVTVVTAVPNYPTGRIADGYRRRLWVRERSGPVALHRVWVLPAVGAGPRRYLNYLSFMVTSLLPLLRLRRADLVIVESPPLTTAVTAMAYRRRLRARIVLNVADLWPDTVVRLGLVDAASPVVRLAYRLERFAYASADAVNYVTEGMGRDLREVKGVEPERLLFLPNGADTDTFRPAPPDEELRARLGLGGRSVFLYAGTHSVAAGMDVLADAADELRRRGRDDIAIVCVGDGPAKPGLRAEVERRGLGNVRFLDPVQPEEVARLYSISTAGLLTLLDNDMLADARPAKVYPAMSCGRPVVYSGRGEAADLLGGAGAAVVVPPQDAVALADAMELLADDASRCAELGANGRRLVEEHFAWPAIVAAWEPLAREVLGLGGSAWCS